MCCPKSIDICNCFFNLHFLMLLNTYFKYLIVLPRHFITSNTRYSKELIKNCNTEIYPISFNH